MLRPSFGKSGLAWFIQNENCCICVLFYLQFGRFIVYLAEISVSACSENYLSRMEETQMFLILSVFLLIRESSLFRWWAAILCYELRNAPHG